MSKLGIHDTGGSDAPTRSPRGSSRACRRMLRSSGSAAALELHAQPDHREVSRARRRPLRRRSFEALGSNDRANVSAGIGAHNDAACASTGIRRSARGARCEKPTRMRTSPLPFGDASLLLFPVPAVRRSVQRLIPSAVDRVGLQRTGRSPASRPSGRARARRDPSSPGSTTGFSEIRRGQRVLEGKCSQHPRPQVGLTEFVHRGEFGLNAPGGCRSLRTYGARRRRRLEIEDVARSRIPSAHRGRKRIRRSCPGRRAKPSGRRERPRHRACTSSSSWSISEPPFTRKGVCPERRQDVMG